MSVVVFYFCLSTAASHCLPEVLMVRAPGNCDMATLRAQPAAQMWLNDHPGYVRLPAISCFADERVT